VFGKLPNTAGKLPALPRKINGTMPVGPTAKMAVLTLFPLGAAKQR